jgi:hypothetical protein
MWDILKDLEVFWIHFQRSGGFGLEIWGFCKDYEAFLNWYEDFIRISRLFEDISRVLEVAV